MVNIVAKLNSPLNVKSCLKMRLAEMRQRLTQRAKIEQQDKFKQSNDENMVDSGLVDSELLSSKDDDYDISFEIIEILNQQCQEYSKNSSRTSTPIFNKTTLDKKHRTVSSARKVSKRSGAKKTHGTPAALSKKTTSYYVKQNDLNYMNLDRNNDYNYNINSQCSTEADMFYNSNSGFQDFGGLKVWYV